MDYSTLVSAVDFGALAAAFLAIGALKVLPLAGQWGIRKVLGMIGR